MTSLSLSIVIPVFNEYERLLKSFPEILFYCSFHLSKFEIVFVDDGSTDATLGLLRFITRIFDHVVVIHYPVNRGKGYAIRRGFMRASMDYVLFMDADLSSDMEAIGGYLRAATKFHKPAALIADRSNPSSIVSRSFPRLILGKVFSTLSRPLTGFSDSMCGFKMFRHDVAVMLAGKCRINGFACDIEMLHILYKLQVPVYSLPIVWHESPGSRIRLVRDSLVMLRDLYRIWSVHG